MNAQREVSFPFSASCELEKQQLTTKLKEFRIRNMNKINFAHIKTK